MNRTWKLVFLILLAAVAIGLVAFFVGTHSISLFNPRGIVALQERNLIALAVAIMLLVAIPMLVTLYAFAWKYRAANKKVKRDLDHAGSALRQLVWWAIPAVIIVTLAIINWKSTHALDPVQPLASDVPPITIQVVALQWKWLFLYPAQRIATVNFIEFPANTPIHFELTADGPMSSFWIPQLGSQIYAMDAMQTQLNLMADTTGDFTGKDTEINGDGYAGMTFVARSASPGDFAAWVASIKGTGNTLDVPAYNALALPSTDAPAAFYSSFSKGLYDTIMMKYMVPAAGSNPEDSSAQAAAEMPGIRGDAMQEVMPASSTDATSAAQGMSGMHM